MCSTNLKQSTILYPGPKIWKSRPVSVTRSSSSSRVLVKKTLNWPSCSFETLSFFKCIVVSKVDSHESSVVSWGNLYFFLLLKRQINDINGNVDDETRISYLEMFLNYAVCLIIVTLRYLRLLISMYSSSNFLSEKSRPVLAMDNQWNQDLYYNREWFI